MKVQLTGVKSDSLIDGPGLRFVIFFQGCCFKCPGCHNPDTWDQALGYTEETRNIQKAWQKHFLIDGITFSGGEPFLQKEALLDLVVKAKSDKLNVTIYTGHLYENLKEENDEVINNILINADFLIDGPFVLAKKNDVLYRGSTNQRIINLRATNKLNKLVLINEYGDFNV